MESGECFPAIQHVGVDSRLRWLHRRLPSNNNNKAIKQHLNNPRALLSGHYGVYGLNIEAICDVQSRFLFIGVDAPCKCGDQDAFKRTPFFQYTQKLPHVYYRVGKAVYSGVGDEESPDATGRTVEVGEDTMADDNIPANTSMTPQSPAHHPCITCTSTSISNACRTFTTPTSSSNSTFSCHETRSMSRA